MDQRQKQAFVAKIQQLKAVNHSHGTMVNTPIQPAPPPPPGAPIMLQPALGVQMTGISQHVREQQRLLALLEDIVKAI